MALHERSRDLDVAVAPFHHLLCSGRSLRLVPYPPSRGLHQVRPFPRSLGWEANEGRALGERLGCTAALAAEISMTASGKGEKQEYGGGEFVDVSGAMAAAGRLPTLRIDGPFGKLCPAVWAGGEVDGWRSQVHRRRTSSRMRVRRLACWWWRLLTFVVGSRCAHRDWNRRHSLRKHPQEHLVSPFSRALTAQCSFKDRRYMQQKNKLGALRRVEFIWVNRDTGSFEWFQTLLKSLEVCSIPRSSQT